MFGHKLKKYDLRLWIAVARHNLKWLKISINYLIRIKVIKSPANRLAHLNSYAT